MKIAISAETTVDMTPDLIEKYKVNIIPFTVILGDREVFDGEISTEEIFDYVNKTKILPKTSAINSAQYEEHFAKLKKDYDAIVHISLSSKISSSCQNAINASKEFENVYVVDSLSLSTGIALLVMYASKLADKGYDAKTIYDKVLERVPYVQTSFELQRLDYLFKGGRCSSLAYFGANLLKLCPEIVMKEGKMVAGRKYRGSFEKVVTSYCKNVLDEHNNPDLENAFVTYTTATEEAKQIAVNALKERGFKNIYVTRAGGTITSHCGERTLGILYINDGGKQI